VRVCHVSWGLAQGWCRTHADLRPLIVGADVRSWRDKGLVQVLEAEDSRLSHIMIEFG
jgi:hypothetical protein